MSRNIKTAKAQRPTKIERGIFTELDIHDAMIDGLFACLEKKGLITEAEWDAETIRKMKQQRGEYESAAEEASP